MYVAVKGGEQAIDAAHRLGLIQQPHQVRSALERLFGQRWEEGHRLVKAWHERIVSATVGAQVVEAVKQESKAKKRKA